VQPTDCSGPTNTVGPSQQHSQGHAHEGGLLPPPDPAPLRSSQGHGATSCGLHYQHSQARARAARVLQHVLEPQWPSPARQEWVLHLQEVGAHAQSPEVCAYSGQGQGVCTNEHALRMSRLYVAQVPGEMRLATVIMSEQQ